jgi:PAS domain S-box-containing protein
LAAEFQLNTVRIEGTELLDALVTSVFLLDQDLNVGYLNAAAQTLLGLGPNQALGRSITELTRGAETLLPLFDRARKGGEGVVQRELAWPAPGGVDRILDCAVTQITLGQENVRLLLEIEDITQHRRLTRENALLAQLGGSRLMVRQLAHEIKNPLGGLRGAAQLLERELLDPSAARVHAGHHQRSRPAHQFARLHVGARPPARKAADQRARAIGARVSLAAQRGTRRRHRRSRLRPQSAAAHGGSEPHHSGHAESGTQRHPGPVGRQRTVAAPDPANACGEQCQRRRTAPSAGRVDSIRRQRPRRAFRNSRHHFLSAGVRPRRRHGSWA